MKKYYVIYKFKDGEHMPAYVINDTDDLDHHLHAEGDEASIYEIFDTETDAVRRAYSYNTPTKK